jgi:spore coat polysaccharide biosynthesis predicted glycosyltransferase SpsG/RimJ/RimL family protein N-acetyltransferase
MSQDLDEYLLVDHYGLQEDWHFAISASRKITRTLQLSDEVSVPPSVETFVLRFPSPNELEDLILGESTTNSDAYQGWYSPMSRSASFIRLKTPINSQETPNGAFKNIAIFLGNSNVDDHVQKIVKAMNQMYETSQLNITVIQNRETLNSYDTKSTGSKWNQVSFQSQESYLEFLSGQDLCIGAGGVAALERLFLGIPQVVFTIASNQIPNAKSLSEWGVITLGGDLNKLNSFEVSRIIEKHLDNPNELRRRAKMGELFLDGHGARRVIQSLVKNPVTNFSLRKANLWDSSTLYIWANELWSRRNSVTRAVIWPEEHARWFHAATANPNSDTEIFMAEDSHGPIGQIRFDKYEANKYLLSYSLDRAFRGQKLGTRLVSMGLERHKKLHPGSSYRAVSLGSNLASIQTLKSLLFEESMSNDTLIQFELPA